MSTHSFHELINGLPNEYHNAVAYNKTMEQNGVFLQATPDEEKDYRQWAREEYQPEMMIDGNWHPIIVDECVQIIKEFISN